MAEEQTLSERIMHYAGNNSEFIPRTEVFRDATGDEGDEVQDAAASQDDALGADQEGNQGEDADDGLDTASGEEGSGADQSDEGDADEHDQKGEEGTRKKTFEERMTEMQEKIRAELAAQFEAKLAAQQAQKEEEKPDFYEPDYEAINKYLVETTEKIEELKLEGNAYEALKLQRGIDKLLAEVEANEAKKAAWEEKQKEKKTKTDTSTAAQQKTLSELDQAADFYRKEMKIEQPVWDKMGAFFAKECTDKPLIGRKFAEKVERLGPIEAVEWAHDYAVKHMGLEAKQAIEKKEQTKTKTAAIAAASTGQKVAVDLKKIKAEFDADPTPDNFARYMDAKRRAAK